MVVGEVTTINESQLVCASRRASRWTLAAAWGVSALPPAVQALDGPQHRVSVLALALGSLLFLSVRLLTRWPMMLRWSSGVLVLVGTAWVVVPRSGRAPLIVVAGASILAAEIAVLAWRRWGERPPVAGGIAPAGVLLAAQLAWLAGVPLALWLGGMALAAVCLAAALQRPSAVAPIDRWATRAAVRLARSRNTASRASAEVWRSTVGSLTPVGGLFAGSVRGDSGVAMWLAARRWSIVAIGGSAVLAIPLFYELASDPTRTSAGFTDFPIHLDAVAETTIVPFSTLTPHWLFHVATALLRPAFGTAMAAALVLALSVGALVGLLTHLARRTDERGVGLAPRWAALAAFSAFFVESPTALFNALGILDPARAFAPFHAWGNPTDTFVMPFQLGLILTVLALEQRHDRYWWRPSWLRGSLAVLAVATTLAKPNVPMVLLGVIPLYLATQRRWQWSRYLELVIWFVVPVVLVLLGQIHHLKTSPKIAEMDPGGWGMTIDPFAFTKMWPAGGAGIWFWLGPLIIALGAWACGRRYWTTPIMRFALLLMLISLVPMVLLRETGLRATDGNFMKAAFAAFMLLVQLSAVMIAREAGHRIHTRCAGAGLPAWIVAAGVFGVLATGAGLMDYLGASLANPWFNPVWPLG